MIRESLSYLLRIYERDVILKRPTENTLVEIQALIKEERLAVAEKLKYLKFIEDQAFKLTVKKRLDKR